MAKPLNDLTGKGYLVNRGQDWVETYLESHTQAELAVLAGYTKNGGPNAGQHLMGNLWPKNQLLKNRLNQ